MLALFSGAIGVSLARGRRPDCHCFGQVHSAPIGWSTLMRNLGLACIAAFVVWLGGGDTAPSFAGLTGSFPDSQMLNTSVNLLIFLSMAALLFQLLRQQGRVLLRLESIDRDNNVQTLEGSPGGWQLPEGAGDDLNVDSALQKERHHRFQFAVRYRDAWSRSSSFVNALVCLIVWLPSLTRSTASRAHLGRGPVYSSSPPTVHPVIE